MRFTKAEIDGVLIVDTDQSQDDRGYSARTWCQREFDAAGINARWVQSLLSFNKVKGTLRGMHYQNPPSAQAKLVQVTRGSIYDVLLDLRRNSPTHLKWTAVEVGARDRRQLYIPQGIAHGYETLEDATEVSYLMSDFYDSKLDAGFRWNDPRFGIRWPAGDKIISARDRSFPDYAP